MSPLKRDRVRAGVPMVDAQGFASMARAAGRINSSFPKLLLYYLRVYDMGLVPGAAPKRGTGTDFRSALLQHEWALCSSLGQLTVIRLSPTS